MSSSTGRSEPGRAWATSAPSASIVLSLTAVFGYDLLNHLAVVSGPRFSIVVAAAVLLSAGAATWAAFRRSAATGACVLAVFAAIAAIMLAWPPAWRLAPLLPQVAMCCALAWLFGRTLLPGREPLITRVARGVHGELPLPIVRYTRNVTCAWAIFLSGMALASIALFVLAPAPVWSLFANLLFLPLIALMFAGEYAYRVMRYPWFSHASIAQTVRAFRGLHLSGSSDAQR